MKSFLKYTLATIVGILISGLLFFIVFFSVVGGMISKGEEPAEIKSQSILKMNLDRTIMDRSSKSPFESFDFMSFEPRKMLGLNDILANIEKAGKDDDIEGIYLDLSVIPAGMATVEEIRNALIDFKESGKFIIAYSDDFYQKAYYLASVADKVYLNPAGRVNLTGLSAQIMFYKEGLDKLGVDMQIIRQGKYKSAAEPFMQNEMSKENRKQTKAYVDALWNQMSEGISKHREINIDTLNRLTNDLVLNSSEISMQYGLVDGLKYKDEIIRELKDSSDVDEDLRLVGLGKYTRVPRIRDYKGLAKDKIAVVYAMGMVIMGEGEEGSIGSDRISRAIRKAREDSSIKAIVFRVNSGGGSALASEVIWRELRLAQREKPVIASFGDVAGSGGYYIAAPADTILASPNSITGSIGVIGMIPNVKELMNDKLGIHTEEVKSHKHADLFNPFRPMKAQEKSVLKDILDETYETFIEHVAQGRDMKEEEVREIAQGRVWSGVDAKQVGLIDDFGGLQKAVAMAAESAGLEKYRTVELPRLKDPFQEFINEFTGNVKTWVLKETLGNEARYYKYLQDASEMKGIQARMPYIIEIN
jgi:protease-4